MNLPSRYVKSNKKFTDGGMSTAILCEDMHLDRPVIVKILHSGVDQKRLIDEVRALSTISSKHVVEIYDVIRNSSGKVRAIVEEYVPGPSLTESATMLDAHGVQMTALAIASGIADVHAAKQIHRDVKPLNMKFDGTGCLKLFDFGLSRPDEDSAATTGVVGSLGYLAPELCVDAEQKVNFTQAVDTFAFASTVLYLIRGQLPKGMRSIPPLLPCPSADFSMQKIALPGTVAAVLNACHSKDPKHRPQMADVRDTLASQILFDRHRATVVAGGQAHELHAGNRSVTVKSGNLGSFSVRYDGLRFLITVLSGSIYVNNVSIGQPSALPGSCVVTVGPPEAASGRLYVPIDVSHPGVIT